MRPGTRLGPYEIATLLGQGGMGEVYRATDTRLDRAVAIKILPKDLTSDSARRARFTREARAVSSLNHPHICTLHDLGTAADGLDYLVMELVDGETLEARLSRGRLPRTRVLEWAIQIAEALDHAHRHGIVHRDLKPGNIMLGKAGVKLLDFGLARLTVDQPPVALSQVVTAHASGPLTTAGTIVGTLAYMAPEQLEGREVDGRSDIFAFGATLYEMLTGRRAFEGQSQASVINAVLGKDPPPVSAADATTPRELDRIVATCLAKDPDDRWRSAGDIARQLKWLADGSAAVAPAVRPAKGFVRPWGFMFAAIAIAAVISGWGVWKWTSRSVPALPKYYSIVPLPSAQLANLGGYDFAVSPDGTQVVFVGRRLGPQGGLALYLKGSGNGDPHVIPGTEMEESTNVNPFFSWDGAFIGFRKKGEGIVSVPVGGGPPSVILKEEEDKNFVGAAWGKEMLVVALADQKNRANNGLYRVSAREGGSLRQLTPPETEGRFYVAPALLPRGDAVLYGIIDQGRQTEQIAVFDLEKKSGGILVEGGANPQYASSGHVVFARGRTLMAIDFDLENLRPSKGATPVSTGADDVRRPSLTAAADFAVSGNGTLVYVRDIAWSERRAVTPVWVGRKGQMVEPARTTPILLPRNFQLSRDDSGLVTMLGSPEKPEIWTYTFDDHAPVLLTKAGRYPVWYPDGRRVAFTSDHTGRWKLYSVASQGSEPKLVPTGDPSSNVSLTSMVPSLPLTFLDGRLVFGQGNISNGGDILVEPAGGGDKPQALVQTELSEDSARVSPDGKWLAYRTNRNLLSGEIWVQRLSNGRKIGDAQQISTKGGFEPVWSRGSNEVVLFYLEPDSPDGPINRPPKMMEVRLLPGGDSFGTPDPLFVSGYDHELVPRASWNFETTRSYDVDRKGRFLMVPRPPSSDVVPGIMRVVENWSEQLKRLAPAH